MATTITAVCVISVLGIALNVRMEQLAPNVTPTGMSRQALELASRLVPITEDPNSARQVLRYVLTVIHIAKLVQDPI